MYYVLFVEFYDRHLQIGLLTFVHFPPPFRCFHHRSFNICNLPPSCNCRIALLIGVRNGESKIENCVIVYELCIDFTNVFIHQFSRNIFLFFTWWKGYSVSFSVQ